MASKSVHTRRLKVLVPSVVRRTPASSQLPTRQKKSPASSPQPSPAVATTQPTSKASTKTTSTVCFCPTEILTTATPSSISAEAISYSAGWTSTPRPKICSTTSTSLPSATRACPSISTPACAYAGAPAAVTSKSLPRFPGYSARTREGFPPNSGLLFFTLEEISHSLQRRLPPCRRQGFPQPRALGSGHSPFFAWRKPAPHRKISALSSI